MRDQDVANEGKSIGQKCARGTADLDKSQPIFRTESNYKRRWATSRLSTLISSVRCFFECEIPGGRLRKVAVVCKLDFAVAGEQFVVPIS